MNRYYSVLRPVSIGTFPAGHNVIAIDNFEDRVYIPAIDRKAWGYIDFEDTLTEQECYQYDLVKGNI